MKKEIAYYMDLDYPITVETYTEDEEVHYSLEIPDLPGCGAEAKNLDEALKKLQDAKELWISASLKRKLPIPEPVSEDDFSGKLLLRIPTKLHMALAKQAKREELSLNQYIKSILEMHTTLTHQRQIIKVGYEEFLEEIKSLREKAIVFYQPPLKDISITTDIGLVTIRGAVTAGASTLLPESQETLTA